LFFVAVSFVLLAGVAFILLFPCLFLVVLVVFVCLFVFSVCFDNLNFFVTALFFVVLALEPRCWLSC
jgi:hypothetical protein